ncbi:hypothetical protein [Comamonas sp. wu1-DMT]|uniref:hypothetical protein n=1 Tax=Comamonas sp. wu1-DMT TaxID=3126390 RepID=UPI0032E475B3
MSQNSSPDNVPIAKHGTADSLAAPGCVGAGGTLNQSIRKSSSRALFVDDLSGMSVQRNPGGAGGAWGDGAAGSLNRASEIPSLTPALIAEYSTQYVSSIPMVAAMNGNSSPSPINPMVASPSLEAADLKDPPFALACRNSAQWQSIADFLTRQNLRQVLKARAQAAAARGPACGDTSVAGEARTLPVGNHGEIVAKGVSA